ncbi:hypothetical protein KP509_32G019900 [Ceratopteris richardii]|uniref:Uncharacterized protein n=1 Tax=Ceratopteris richardii TaxID=49495 RepID=A0A8T2QTM6_CERRI|nr:hypothetical protein KP509_32G019900 [Ceratopteris richardii]
MHRCHIVDSLCCHGQAWYLWNGQRYCLHCYMVFLSLVVMNNDRIIILIFGISTSGQKLTPSMQGYKDHCANISTLIKGCATKIYKIYLCIGLCPSILPLHAIAHLAYIHSQSDLIEKELKLEHKSIKMLQKISGGELKIKETLEHIKWMCK